MHSLFFFDYTQAPRGFDNKEASTMLTAVQGMLASLHTMQETPEARTGWDQFVDRVTNDPVRSIAAVLVFAVVLGVLFVKAGTFFLKVMAILTAFVAGWLVWGIINLAYSDTPQPLVTLPIELDFYSLFDGWNKIWFAVPVFGFVAMMSRGKRTFGQLLLSGLVAAGLTLLVLLGQQAWRNAEANKEGAAQVTEQQI